MNLAAAVAGLASDLAALGSLGDEAMVDAADKLATVMEGPITARLLEILGQAAAELDAGQSRARVEVRLVGGDAQLVLVNEEPPADAVASEPEGDADARITLRLSSTLKARIEAASAQEGISVNTWIVRALGRQSRPPTGSSVARRISGYGRS